jgi:acyl-CoA thioesterase-1
MLKKASWTYWRTGPLKQVLSFSPAIVVLMLGTNDAKSKNWGPFHAEFPLDYKAMIDELNTISTHPKVYLMVPPPLYVDGIGASPNVLLHTAWLRYM